MHEHQLDPKRISLHHTRIIQALNQQIKTTIPILGACTTSNGGILSWKLITRILSSAYHPSMRKFQKSSMRYWQENYLISCFPAAGAASRFFSDLQKFILNLESKIPELKEVFHFFKNPKKEFYLDLGKRRYIQETLSNFKISPDLSTLYDALQEQEIDEGKVPTENFYHFLNQLIRTGSAFFQSDSNKKVQQKVRHYLQTPKTLFAYLGNTQRQILKIRQKNLAKTLCKIQIMKI